MKLTLLMALTLDGRIAKDADHFADWTESADKKLFVQMTKQAGVVIMGRKTFDTILRDFGKPLPGRKNVVLTRDPERQRRESEFSPTSNVWYSNDKPAEILRKLADEGYSEAILAGGTTINSLFAKAGLIDEVVVTVSPVIFGSGLGLFDESIEMDLGLKSVEKLGDNSLKAVYEVRR